MEAAQPKLPSRNVETPRTPGCSSNGSGGRGFRVVLYMIFLREGEDLLELGALRP